MKLRFFLFSLVFTVLALTSDSAYAICQQCKDPFTPNALCWTIGACEQGATMSALLARSFTRTSAAALVAVVATPAQRGEAPPFFVHRDGDNLVFVWQTDDVHRRSLPAALSGYQALVHVRQLICKAPDAMRSR